MYFQLGDLRFEGLFGFGSMSISDAGRFPEHSRISSKPRIQFTGSELQTISLSIPLRREVADVESVLGTLDRYNSTGAILPLIDGSGKYYGQYVLTSISKSVATLDTDGAIISVAVSVELKEFVNDSRETTEAVSARRTATALTENKPVTVPSVDTNSTILLKTLSTTSVGQNNVSDSIGLINKASINPTQAAGLMAQIKVKMETAEKSFSDAITFVMEKQEKFQNVSENFEFDLDAIKTTANSIKLAAEAGNINDVLNLSSLLTSRSLNLSNSIRPLDILSISRKNI